MSFWGCVVKPGREVAFVPPPDADRLHLSQACLAPGASKDSRTTVFVRVGDAEQPLAITALREGTTEAASLDLVLDCYAEFTVEGKGTVHLTGYYMPDLEIGEDEEEDSDDEGQQLVDLENSVVGFDEFGLPVLAGDAAYNSEDDSDYESEDEEDSDDEGFDSAEEDFGADFEDDLAKLLGSTGKRRKIEIKDITDEEDDEEKEGDGIGGGQAAKVTGGGGDASQRANGKAAAFEDEDVSASDEDEVDEDEEEKVEKYQKPEPKARSTAQKRKADEVAAATKTPKTDNKEKKQIESDRKKDASAVKNLSSTTKAKGKEEAASTPASEKKASKSRVRRWPNGFAIEDLSYGPADGKLAKPGKKVSVRYTGRLSNGKVFDQTSGRSTFTFRLGVGEVVKGFDRGLTDMRVGDKRRVTIPPQMGYGASKVGSIPPNSTLVFDLELCEVK